MNQQNTKWWQEAVIYQIYPRSFKDSNGDGIGDIPGIIEKLDYLKDLGIDALWISPMYVSPNKDYGYDIADYTGINPEFGTMEDMRTLLSEAKKRDIRIIMDLVINHTSDQHPWFQKSRHIHSPYRDYYIWQKGRKTSIGKTIAPNNWVSFFTGPAWQKDSLSGEYYLHLFTKEQPDLNYRNPKVIQEVKNILKFWLDSGVAGFRCDVINVIYKDSLENGKPALSARGKEHYLSSDGSHQVLKELRRDALEPYNAFTVGETTAIDLEDAKKYTQGDELDTIFSFEHVVHGPSLTSQVPRLKRALVKWQENMPWNTLFLENHDQPRAVSTYGSERVYREASAKALATVLLTLRGTPFIYQGQEIGMTNAPFHSVRQAKDPVTRFIYDMLSGFGVPTRLATSFAFTIGRDNARTPMQWSADKFAGFSTGKPWMLVNPNYRYVNVKNAQLDDLSVLNYYKKLLHLRKDHPSLTRGTIDIANTSRYLFIYTRHLDDETVFVAVNLSRRRRWIKLEYPENLEIILSTHQRFALSEDIRLEPFEAIVLKSKI